MNDPLAYLGVIEDLDPQAWADYVASLRDDMQASWSRAEKARAALKKVRETLELPFIVDSPGEPGAPGAWNSDFDQNVLEVKALVTLLSQFADELLNGVRPLMLDKNDNEFVIGGLPADTLAVRVLNGKPTVVDAKTGAPVPVSGTLGAGPLTPGIIAIGAASLVATGILAYAITTKVCDTIESTAKQRTLETIGTAGRKLVDEQKATPEQVAMMDKALFEGQAAVTQAEAAKEKESDQWPKTIRTVGLIALGIAGIWFAAQLFGRRGGGAAAPAFAENPTTSTRGGDLVFWFPRRDQAESKRDQWIAKGAHGVTMRSKDSGYEVVVPLRANSSNPKLLRTSNRGPRFFGRMRLARMARARQRDGSGRFRGAA